jgi:hypothetical protein
MHDTSDKQSRAEAGPKRYKEIEQFVDFANLFRYKRSRDGVQHVIVGRKSVREDALPTFKFIGTLPRTYQSWLVPPRFEWDMNPGWPPERGAQTSEGGSSIDLTTEQKKMFDEIEGQFNKQFPRGIRVSENIWTEFEDPFVIYRYYLATRETFISLERQFSNWNERRSFVLITIPLRTPEQRPFVANYDWNKSGSFDPILSLAPDFIWDGLRRALSGHDGRRFKRCPICGSFFFARRVDKGACSVYPTCLGLNRQRQYRAKSADYQQTRKSKT